MKEDALTISFAHEGDSEDVRQRLEALANGLVDINLIELKHYDGFSGLDMTPIKYEDPQMGKYGQRIGSLSQVLRKMKATCIEAAAIDAALLIHDDGIDAKVVIVPEMVDGVPKPFHYHAVVKDEMGNIYDSTQKLRGYHGSEDWWEDHGHCCPNCAIGEVCLGEEGGCGCGGKH